MEAAALQRPTVLQVILGLFISWQLFFLLAANYLAFLPHGHPEEGELSDSRSAPDETGGTGTIQKAINLAAAVTDAWAHLTGQTQAWWLFAPDVPKMATFPVVELRWDDDSCLAQPVGHVSNVPPHPVRLQTTIEPNDPYLYFRTFSSFERLFHYEVRLGLILANWNEQTFAEHPESWRTVIKERVRRQWRSIRAYLRWKMHQFQQEHPEMPMAKQAILWIRMYPIPEPEHPSSMWWRPVERPLARWWIDLLPPPGELPIEVFDPVAGRFATLSEDD
jgi:hypothetical protein